MKLQEQLFKKYQKVFANADALLGNTRNVALQQGLLIWIMRYALLGGHGHYSSYSIERYYLGLAGKIKVELPDSYEKDTCLIVMSRAYESGGHTRVVERWIETDVSRKYSVAFTYKSPHNVTERLRLAVKKSGGRIVTFPDGDDVFKKSTSLREIASGFESVVLFTHMEDETPIVAFGSEDFKRPIGLYNHADHRFWLGVSIADHVADMRKWGQELALQHRGTHSSDIIQVPVDTTPIRIVEKKDARTLLSLSQDKKIVLTVGRPVKYRPSGGIDMANVIENLLSNHEDVFFVGVGVKESDYPRWMEIGNRHGGRVLMCGAVDHTQLYNYYFAADLVLDSIPFGGITAMADALKCGCPLLSMLGDVDWLFAGPSYCQTVQELIDKASLILSDVKFGQSIHDTQYKMLIDAAGADAFRRAIGVFLAKLCAMHHQIRAFTPVPRSFDATEQFYVSAGGKAFRGCYWQLRLRIIKPCWLSVLALSLFDTINAARMFIRDKVVAKI